MKINKELLQKAEKEGLIKSTDELWDFFEKSKRSGVSILNIIGGIMIVFGIMLLSFMFLDANQPEIAGAIIFITGLGLNHFINKIDTKDMTFKISNLIVYLLLCFGVFVGFDKVWIHLANLTSDLITLKLIEIPAFILSIYFYRKNKNEYMLVIPFLIVTFMLFNWIDLSVDAYRRKDIWLQKVTTILLYMNLIVLSILTYYKRLPTKENIAFITLSIMFNINALIYFFEMHRIFDFGYNKLEYIFTIISLNTILALFSKYMNKNNAFEALLFGMSFGWLFMIDFFESIIFISATVALLAYGIYKSVDKLIRLATIILVISVEQIVNLEDITQIMYYIIVGIILILLNKYLTNKREENVESIG